MTQGHGKCTVDLVKEHSLGVIDDLRPHPRNPRAMPERGATGLRASIKAFGDIAGIVWNARTGTLVCGHQRVDALRSEYGDALVVADNTITTPTGEQFRVRVVDVDESAHVAMMLAANHTAIQGEWHGDLAALVAEASAGVDLDAFAAIGFDELRELGGAMNGGGPLEDDEVPEPPKTPVTKLGDVWQLGDHRLVCGDCRDESTVDVAVDGAKINVAVSSPPYAQQREYDTESGFVPIPPDEYVEWFCAVQANIAANMADDGSWFLNIKEHCEDGQRALYVKDLTLAHVREWSWRFVDEFIWTHGGTPKAVSQRFKNGWEPIFQFTKGRHKFVPDAVMHATDDVPDWKGMHPNAEDVQGITEGMRRKGVDVRAKKSNPSTTSQQCKKGQTGGYTAKRTKTTPGGFNAKGQGIPSGGKAIHDALVEAVDIQGGMAYPSNVLSLGKNREALGHSAAFPIGLPDFFIKAFSYKGDTVYDPFCGSGTTIIAAAKRDRIGIGCELSPSYCDVIVERWQNLTGGKATRQAGKA